MKKGLIIVAICLLVIGGFLGLSRSPVVAQTVLSIEGFLGAVFDSTNSALQISIVANTDTVTGDLTVNGWTYAPPVTVAQQSYTVVSTSKAGVYNIEYTDTGAATFALVDTPDDGLVLTVRDGELNASSNNITVATAGSDTINEAATYVMNADGESVTMMYDAGNTDWMVLGGYAE